jgi:hypothetical protein
MCGKTRRNIISYEIRELENIERKKFTVQSENPLAIIFREINMEMNSKGSSSDIQTPEERYLPTCFCFQPETVDKTVPTTSALHIFTVLVLHVQCTIQNAKELPFHS